MPFCFLPFKWRLYYSGQDWYRTVKLQEICTTEWITVVHLCNVSDFRTFQTVSSVNGFEPNFCSPILLIKLFIHFYYQLRPSIPVLDYTNGIRLRTQIMNFFVVILSLFFGYFLSFKYKRTAQKLQNKNRSPHTPTPFLLGHFISLSSWRSGWESRHLDAMNKKSNTSVIYWGAFEKRHACFAKRVRIGKQGWKRKLII